MARPREVSVALGMLWLTLGLASVEALLDAANWFGLIPFASRPQIGTLPMQAIGLFGGLLFQLLCLVSISRGHGWIRWPLLIGIGWIVSKLAVSGGSLIVTTAASHHRIEPLGFALRIAAVTLLFLPRSNSWFREMRSLHRRSNAPSEAPASSAGETVLAPEHCMDRPLQPREDAPDRALGSATQGHAGG